MYRSVNVFQSVIVYWSVSVYRSVSVFRSVSVYCRVNVFRRDGCDAWQCRTKHNVVVLSLQTCIYLFNF